MTADGHESDTWLERLLPRFRYGAIVPGSGTLQRGVDYQFYRLVPLDVMQINVGLGVKDYSAESVEAAMGSFWECVTRLASEEVGSIMLSGAPVSAALGRAKARQLMEQVLERTSIPFDTTIEAIIRAVHFLGARRIALASRFPADVNALLAAYLGEADIEVVGSTSREISLGQAGGMSLAEGMQITLEVGREAARLAPSAEAILVPGGAALSLHAIPALESEFSKPVLTNLSAEVWSTLMRPNIIPGVENWGKLLANHKPND